MKSTGIVRHIDDLGRVVIPKEIRRTLRIREGDPLELFVEDGAVLFKKFSALTTLEESVKGLLRSFSSLSHLKVVVSDSDFVLTTSGNVGKSLAGQPLSSECCQLVRARLQQDNLNGIRLVEGKDFLVKASFPIISDGECLGAVMAVDSEPLSERDYVLLMYMRHVLESQLTA